MKTKGIIVVVLGMCVSGIAQSGIAQSTDKAAGQNPAPGPSASAPAAPQGKRPPQAKTQPEFQAYKDTMAMTDPAAEEKAADDFATKFPDSELRVLLYESTMQKYQQTNNGDKMIALAQKALSIDPDDPVALLGTAQVLAERTHDTDLDKDQKLAEAKKDAERALVTIDTDVPTSGYSPEQLSMYKGRLRSDAYAVVGTLAFNAKNWPEAESDLRKSVDADPQEPDAVSIFRLAVTLDMQNKIPEAMKYADQAVDLTKDRPDSAAGKAARDEKDRLTKLNVGSAPGQPPAKK